MNFLHDADKGSESKGHVKMSFSDFLIEEPSLDTDF